MIPGSPLDYLPYVVQSTRFCPTEWHERILSGNITIEGPEVRYGHIDLFLEVQVKGTVRLNEMLIFLPKDGILNRLTECRSAEHNHRQWGIFAKRREPREFFVAL